MNPGKPGARMVGDPAYPSSRDATRINRGVGNNNFRRVQLDQGHGRKDKDPTAEVPGLCYGWWDTVQKHTSPSRQ